MVPGIYTMFKGILGAAAWTPGYVWRKSGYKRSDGGFPWRR
jgi:hypothetical protein